ncbi:MAG TPA: hypothetical protein ENK13_03825, partial [Thermopetrobacter sp.]|nr:hypothetical protein [Thermopetrobacter sp.]
MRRATVQLRPLPAASPAGTRRAWLLATPWGTALLAWLFLCLLLLVRDAGSLGVSLGDTDDAMRLVQWRLFAEGAGWYDRLLPRVDPPYGLHSHWSRLIDAGMNGVHALFALFLPDAMAEMAMRAAWPLLWLLPALVAVLSMARRFGGPEVMRATALIAVYGMQAHGQFAPGRVDHHNV